MAERVGHQWEVRRDRVGEARARHGRRIISSRVTLSAIGQFHELQTPLMNHAPHPPDGHHKNVISLNGDWHIHKHVRELEERPPVAGRTLGEDDHRPIRGRPDILQGRDLAAVRPCGLWAQHGVPGVTDHLQQGSPLPAYDGGARLVRCSRCWSGYGG